MSSDDDPKLPDDVVQEILKRLPVRSLLRFRCVSRSWCSAIDHRRFVALHMNHSALDPSNWHTLCLDLRGINWHNPCLDRRDPLQKVFFLFSESQLQLPFDTPPHCYGFVGSCNGLICVAEISGCSFGRLMYLWNSFTRKHKALPRSRLESKFKIVHVTPGFGYDAGSNDYKIVRILYILQDNGRFSRRTEPRIEIYSLCTDSWRSLECDVPALRYDNKAVFLNGNLHWFTFKFPHLLEEGGYGPIALFDVAGEVFDEMAPPEEISRIDTVMSVVAVLNDLLAVFISFTDAEDPELRSHCSVWVMREYRAPKSWTKLYTFEAWGVVTRFYGFARNGKVLMEIDNEERVSWDPISGCYANLLLPMQCDLVNVLESLVSL